MIARLRARRNPWAAAQAEHQARLAEQMAQYEQYGPTPAEEARMAERLIVEMQAEHLARRWTHRTVLAVELELRQAIAPERGVPATTSRTSTKPPWDEEIT